MKNLFRCTLGLAAVSTLLAFNVRADNLPEGSVDFGRFTPPAGGEFVEVNVNSSLISLAARLAEKQEPQVAKLIRGIKHIRVNVIGLNQDNITELETRIKSIQKELADKKWERVVTAQQKNQDVGVYLLTHGDDAIQGVTVTVLESKKQAVLVNVVGDIKPEEIALLGERFNIDPLKKAGQAIGGGEHHRPMLENTK